MQALIGALAYAVAPVATGARAIDGFLKQRGFVGLNIPEAVFRDLASYHYHNTRSWMVGGHTASSRMAAYTVALERSAFRLALLLMSTDRADPALLTCSAELDALRRYGIEPPSIEVRAP